MYASALPREIRSSEICVKINRKPEKHLQHYQSYLEQGLANFNNIWQKYLWHNWLLNKCFSFHFTQCLLLHYLGKSASIMRVKMKGKTSINSIYPNLFAPTACLLQGLQQCVYQMKFRNVCEARSDW